MKNKNLFAAFFFLIVSYTYGQNSKHQLSSGKVIFDVAFDESKMDEKTKANLPTESTLWFKDDKAKVEVTMPMGKTVLISDNKTGDGVMLMDMMGSKFAVKTSKAEMEKQKGMMDKPKIELTRETKMIAGYNCKKAVVTAVTKRGESTFDVWYTNELKGRNSFSSQIEGIDGFLMEFYNNQNGMRMKMTARTVEAMNVPDSEFAIPEGYEVKTMEEIMSGFGKSK